MLKTHTKKILIISALGVFGLAAAGGVFVSSQFSKESAAHSTSVPVSDIAGLEDRDRVIIEAANGEDFISLYDGEFSQAMDALKNAQKQTALSQSNRYNLMFTIRPDTTEPTDISMLVDKQAGSVRVQASGLSPEQTSSLRINGQAVEKDVPADWSGNIGLQTFASLDDTPSTQVCVDVGGYRGGSLSVCHDVQSTIQKAQFGGGFGGLLGGLAGGFGGGGGGIEDSFIAPMMMMTEQLSTVALHQVEIFGMFLDAKHQLETQRLIQKMTARAHKDYFPSEQVCSIGTMVRSLAQSEGKLKFNRIAINNHMMDRELVNGERITYSGRRSDSLARIDSFIDFFCNPMDDARELHYLCLNTPSLAQNKNMDVDYTDTVELQLTLDIDTLDGVETDDERIIFALLHNLFLNEPHTYIPPAITPLETTYAVYQDLRSISAMRGIARNSMANIIGQRTPGAALEDNSGPYIRALLREFGLTDIEIADMVGANPSYFAQMEVLTKKIYQHPNFFTNLYDKPANVSRISAAMEAIKLMQDRDIHKCIVTP